MINNFSNKEIKQAFQCIAYTGRQTPYTLRLFKFWNAYGTLEAKEKHRLLRYAYSKENLEPKRNE